MGGQLPRVVHRALRAAIVLFMVMRCPQLSWISDGIPETTPSPYWHIPSLASNARALSGGPLFRGGQRLPGVREPRARGIPLLFGASHLACWASFDVLFAKSVLALHAFSPA